VFVCCCVVAESSSFIVASPTLRTLHWRSVSTLSINLLFLPRFIYVCVFASLFRRTCSSSHVLQQKHHYAGFVSGAGGRRYEVKILHRFDTEHSLGFVSSFGMFFIQGCVFVFACFWTISTLEKLSLSTKCVCWWAGHILLTLGSHKKRAVHQACLHCWSLTSLVMALLVSRT